MKTLRPAATSLEAPRGSSRWGIRPQAAREAADPIAAASNKVRIPRIQQGVSFGRRFSGEATPIEYGGVIYTTTGADDVFAISVDTGKILWTYHPGFDQKIPTLCCAWNNRGVAIGQGMVYLGQLDGKLVALDQRTGAVVWQDQLGDPDRGETITMAPLYYDGRVYIGMSGGEYGVRGRLTALDAATGDEDWRFWTIPGPGQPGHDTWPAQPIPNGDPIVPQSITPKEVSELQRGVPVEWKYVNHGRLYTPPTDAGIIAKPSTLGGANWPPSSF